MSFKKIFTNLDKIFHQALLVGDNNLALKSQIAIAKYYLEIKKIESIKIKHNKTNFDFNNLSENDLLKLINDISKQLS
jgi:hypothetical protein